MRYSTMVLGMMMGMTGVAGLGGGAVAAQAVPAPAPPPGIEAETRLSTAVPEFSAPQDPADSLYRAGREALNRGDYQRSATLFAQVRQRFPRSSYVPDSYYWQAFALYRSGSTQQMSEALRLIEQQRQQHSDATTRRDSEVLATRIRGALAQRGDAVSAAAIAERAAAIAPPPPRPAVAPTPAVAPRPDRGQDTDEDDLKVAALNALLHMDSDRALPILRQVLARRDASSVELRRRAVFLVARQKAPEVADMLLDAARNDPDSEVREQAVFWLSRVDSDRAIIALDSILRTSDDYEVRDKAIYALSRHDDPRAARALRDFASDGNAPEKLRGQAIFWLGKHHAEESQSFLRTLYGQLSSEELKDRVIYSLSRSEAAANRTWLIELASNANESVKLRKQALFWAGRRDDVSIGDLTGLYDRMADFEIKKQLIFVYSRRKETEAVDKLMQIAERDGNPDLRKNAIFWLGRSDDPRVAEFLLRLINQP